MFSHVRTATCIAILLLSTTVSVFASSSPIRMLIQPGSEQVVTFRYQTGTKAKGIWKEVDATHSTQMLEDFDSDKEFLFIQQKETDQDWGRTYKYHYDIQTHSWLPVIKKPLFIDSMDIRPYALFPIGSSSSLYSIVTGASLKLNLTFDEHNREYGYCEAGYSLGPSQTDWADSMQAMHVSAGMGYRFILGKNFEIAPELGYGLILHLLYGDLDQDGTKAYEPFIDQQFRLSFNLSFAPTELYELLVAPLGVLFFEKDRVAALYGFQAGIRFNF